MGYRGGGGGYGGRGGGGYGGRGGGGYRGRGGGGYRGRGGGGGYGDRGPVEMHPVKCADCGTDTQVPFKPTQDRPVYCRDCYQKQRGDSGGGRGGYGGRGGGRGGYGGRGGGDRFSRPAPNASVREGEVYEVDITEVGNKGDGITRVENFVVFVPGAQKGDHVKIRIREVMQRFAVAEVDSGDAASDSGEPARTEEAGPKEESEGDSEESEGDSEEGGK